MVKRSSRLANLSDKDAIDPANLNMASVMINKVVITRMKAIKTVVSSKLKNPDRRDSPGESSDFLLVAIDELPFSATVFDDDAFFFFDDLMAFSGIEIIVN